MPVESAPTLRSVHDNRPLVAPAASAPRLSRSDVAPGDVVEPLLRSVRGSVAALRLGLRAAEQRALAAEAALAVAPDAPDSGLEVEGAARRAALDAEIQARRRMRDAAVDEARRQAALLVTAAQEDARAVVAAAREELSRSLNSIPGAPPLPTMTAPPPAAGPSYPPPSPAPTIPPPMKAAPLAGSFAPSFTTVLVQAPDGTLQQMLMLTPGGFAAPAAAPVAPVPVAMPALMPASVASAVAPPAPAIPVQEVGPALPARRGRGLLHLDVLLPLVAVAIVLVVLLAWLG